jgi:phage-related protein
VAFFFGACSGVKGLAIAVLEVFPKDTRATPDDVIRNCRRRLAEFRKVES